MCDRNLDEIPCRQRPCQPPEKKHSESSEDVNASLRGRPLLYTGVVWIGIVRRFLIPRTCGSYQRPNDAVFEESVEKTETPRAVSHVQAVNSNGYEPPLRIQREKPVPLITDSPEETQQDLKSSHLRRPEDRGVSLTSPLKAMVIQVQEASVVAATQARGLSQELGTILRDSQETTAEVIDTVRSEDGRKFRLAMISGCGVIGYLAGRKRGVITRLVYSASGATAMATICYPEETKIYNRQGLVTVKRWMVLGFSIFRRGPKPPLGGSDMNISHFDTSNYNEEMTNTTDSVQTSYSIDNIIANLKDNIRVLGHHIEDIKTKLKESSSTTVTNESTEESITNSAYPQVPISVSKNSQDHQPLAEQSMPNRLQNLSTENGKTSINHPSPDSVPFSPALPVPPKVNLRLSQDTPNKIPQINKKDTLPDNPIEANASTIKYNRSSERVTSHTADELSGGVDVQNKDEDDIEQTDDDFSDFSNKVFVMPTGKLNEILENKKGHRKKTDFNENIEAPLNKKLGTYYRNIPEEEKTSRERGYGDAYSNRGK